ncbi:hypothetical protein ACFCW6_20650 [Streptomyces sp. NPDC056333]|uniref:hypothetical protein n=1 Tax=Streptomyces sp. NPDC056333 TaxID=3345786 RepID=UPI0035E1AA82
MTMYAISLGGDDPETRPLKPWRDEEFLVHIERGREVIGLHDARLGTTRGGVLRASHLYLRKRHDEEDRSVLAPQWPCGQPGVPSPVTPPALRQAPVVAAAVAATTPASAPGEADAAPHFSPDGVMHSFRRAMSSGRGQAPT